MPRCKPGDIAIIINSYFPNNIGLIVKVIKAFSHDDPNFDFPNWKSMWLVECNQMMQWDNEITGRTSFRLVGPRSDAYLQPIRALPPKKRSSKKRNTLSVTKQKTADPMHPAVDLIEQALEEAMGR